MAVSTDLYHPGVSWLHQADPRVKLLLVAVSLVLLVAFENLWFMSASLLLLHLLHWSAGTPAEKIQFVWKTLLPVGILMLILRVIFYPEGETIVSFWVVQITHLGLARGFVLALRILSMALAVFAWLYTTTQSALVQSLVRLGIPHDWGMVLALSLRYIPTFQGTYALISEAQQARGLDIHQHTGFKRVRIMMPIFIAMIISSLRASTHLSMALEARGYGAPGSTRTSLYELQLRAEDFGLIVILILLFATLLYLNLWHGVGEHPLLWSL